MKYSAILLFAVISLVTSPLFADVFASRIQLTNPDGSKFDGNFKDGTGAKISFYLNDTATAIVVKVLDAANGQVVATINSSNKGPSTNPNSVVWDGGGSVSGKKYYISVTTTGRVYSETKYKAFYFQNTSAVGTITRGIYTRGVDINTNMDSPGFGYWYASNSDPGNNDGYRQGTLRYNADGSFAGTNEGHPILLNTLGTANGGVFDWGATTPWSAALDSKGRVYQVSSGSGFVTRLDTDTSKPKIIVRGIVNPRGLYCVGSGANLKIYLAADTSVWRLDIGNDDTLTKAPVLVAALGNYVRDVILDDGGKMYATVRTGTSGTAPGYLERYDISGTLPVRRNDALYSLSMTTGQPVCFAIKHGLNLNSAEDDTIYYSVRGANAADSSTYGIHELTNVDGFFAETKQIFKSGDFGSPSLGGNNNASADIALDWAGNIIWFENSNEEIFMIAPPRAASSVTLTTRGYDTVMVNTALSVSAKNNVPTQFSLQQNFPNPFNPTTTIGFTLQKSGFTTLKVYDAIGREVATLVNEVREAGVYHYANFNASGLSSGLYYYTLRSSNFVETRKMLLTK